MTLFLNAHADRLAPGSFQEPVPLPAGLPGDPPFVTVCFNQDWLPYVLGCLFQLALNTSWQTSTQAELDNALGQANNLILIFQMALAGCQTKNPGFAGAGDDFMLRQNPTNPCLLETSVNGTDWCVWADLSKCTGQAQQPAKGSDNPPSGGCTNSFATVEFGSRWMLPQNVNSGDVVTVTNAIGTWASALDLYIPRCPDGNIFFEVGCVSGTGHTEPGDPANTINHDSLIAFDGTNYYDCGAASDNTPVVITIPPGISNANLFFFANTPDTTGFGAVNFDVNYCNNQTAAWTATIDFRNTTGGFVIGTDAGQPEGHWVAGQGWVFSDVTGLPQTIRVVEGTLTFPASTLTEIDAVFVFANGLNDANASVPLQEMDTNIGTIFSSTAGSGPTGSPVTRANPISQTGVTHIHIELISDDTNSAPTGNVVLQKLIVSGTGPDPF
jgi:hypothetical protein